MDKGVQNSISIDECFNFLQTADKALRETFGTSLFQGKSDLETAKIQKHLSDVIWNLIRISIILTDENKQKIDEGWNQAVARIDEFIQTAK
jgi:NTP pyrophosphatase (non-canonical NTP hydrolase)